MTSIGVCPEDKGVSFDANLIIGITLSVVADIVVAIALSITKVSHNRNWDPVAKKPRQAYIKLPLWWLGILLTAGGEVGNLIAYGFAPAAIVAPVGSVGVLMNAFLATCCLKEPLRRRDVVGMISIIAGVVLLVLGVPQTTVVLTDDVLTYSVLPNVRCWGYLGALFSCVVVLLIFRKKYAHLHPLYYLMLCALISSVTVIAARAFSSMVTLAFGGYLPPVDNSTRPFDDLDDLSNLDFGSGLTPSLPPAPPASPPPEPYSVGRALSAPIFYASLTMIVLTAVFSVKYLNAAMMLFGNSVVVPLYYCTFTLASVIGAAIVYDEFACMTLKTGAMFGSGCACAIGGVWLVGGGRKSKLEEEIATGDNLAHPGQDIAEALHLPNVFGLGDSVLASPLNSPKQIHGHRAPPPAPWDASKPWSSDEHGRPSPAKYQSTGATEDVTGGPPSSSSSRVIPRPAGDLEAGDTPGSGPGYLGYLKSKMRRGSSGNALGVGGARDYTEMGELGPHTPPSWANDADVFVREAASDAMRRLSEHGPDSPVPDRYRSGGSRQGPDSEAVFRNTAQLLREEEQRRRAAFASMGESDSGREVYAAAVRQQLGRLNRKLGSGRGGPDPGARDGLPVEVTHATRSYMEALHAHYASISGAIRGRSNSANPEFSPCLAPIASSPYAERSYGPGSSCGGDRGYGPAHGGERSFSTDRGFNDPGGGGAYGGAATTVSNQAALARARRAASCSFSTSGAASPGLYGTPPPPPMGASLSNIALFDEDGPAGGSADPGRTQWASPPIGEGSDLI